MTTPKLAHRFFGLDLETTCLDPREENAAVLEWAFVLCADAPGDTLEVVRQETCTVYHPPPRNAESLRARAPERVRAMHDTNGLWAECSDPGRPTLALTDLYLASVLNDLGATPHSVILLGSSVHFDLEWSQVHLPLFAAQLSHRVLDVSTLTMAANVWGAGLPPPGCDSPHRALPDILYSWDVARRFRVAAGWAP